MVSNSGSCLVSSITFCNSAVNFPEDPKACYDMRVPRDFSMELRKNKRQTQMAINAIRDYLNGHLNDFRDLGGTIVEPFIDQDGSHSGVRVSLLQNPICEIIRKDDKVDRVNLFDGSHYDREGNLSSTTKERLNGILNYLAVQNILPDGIKAYLDYESGVSFIGKDTARVAFGRDYVNAVSIDATPRNFSMQVLVTK